MADTGVAEISWRAERAEHSLLAWAFVLSLALHLTVYGTYEVGKKLGWWDNMHLPAWVRSSKMLNHLIKKPDPAKQQPKTEPEVSLVFVDVNPAVATPEPPKETKYYSDKSSKAANPEPDADKDAPRIDGKQTQMLKTED